MTEGCRRRTTRRQSTTNHLIYPTFIAYRGKKSPDSFKRRVETTSGPDLSACLVNGPSASSALSIDVVSGAVSCGDRDDRPSLLSHIIGGSRSGLQSLARSGDVAAIGFSVTSEALLPSHATRSIAEIRPTFLKTRFSPVGCPMAFLIHTDPP